MIQPAAKSKGHSSRESAVHSGSGVFSVSKGSIGSCATAAIAPIAVEPGPLHDSPSNRTNQVRGGQPSGAEPLQLMIITCTVSPILDTL